MNDSFGTDPAFAPTYVARAQAIDAAYSANEWLTVPQLNPWPFDAQTTALAPDLMHWNKRIVFLIDELSVSCADMVPALVKANGLATLFGQTTVGGGGNNNYVTTLNHTGGDLSMTRGLMNVYDPTGAYPEASFIEDNGVAPDIVYSHTVADVRANFAGYI